MEIAEKAQVKSIYYQPKIFTQGRKEMLQNSDSKMKKTKV